jgi:hypothetical protein
MTASIREQAIAAAVALIDAATTTPVYRSRAAAFATAQLPAIVVSPTRDTPSDRDTSLCWQSWDLQLAVDVVVATEPPDQAADPLVQSVHAAMMGGSRDLGVDGITDVAPISTEFMVENSGTITGVTRMVYAVRYRTRHADLTIGP